MEAFGPLTGAEQVYQQALDLIERVRPYATAAKKKAFAASVAYLMGLPVDHSRSFRFYAVKMKRDMERRACLPMDYPYERAVEVLSFPNGYIFGQSMDQYHAQAFHDYPTMDDEEDKERYPELRQIYERWLYDQPLTSLAQAPLLA